MFFFVFSAINIIAAIPPYLPVVEGGEDTRVQVGLRQAEDLREDMEKVEVSIMRRKVLFSVSVFIYFVLNVHNSVVCQNFYLK